MTNGDLIDQAVNHMRDSTYAPRRSVLFYADMLCWLIAGMLAALAWWML